VSGRPWSGDAAWQDRRQEWCPMASQSAGYCAIDSLRKLRLHFRRRPQAVTSFGFLPAQRPFGSVFSFQLRHCGTTIRSGQARGGGPGAFGKTPAFGYDQARPEAWPRNA
jgi:hypothetical protein